MRIQTFARIVAVTVALTGASCAAFAQKVALSTSMGEIVIELDAAKAPKTVENFVQYVNAGQYNGTVFHRVIENFMIQGGGFTPDMKEKATRAPIGLESKNGLSNSRGSVAMARGLFLSLLLFGGCAAGGGDLWLWRGCGRFFL